MSARNKIIGTRLENEVVQQFKEAGAEARRAWGSNGKALGEHAEVDVLVSYTFGTYSPEGYNTLKIQCKHKKVLPKFIGLSEHVDASIIRQKGSKESWIVMRTEDFIEKFIK